ncbi:MAG: zinc-dependent alcohol dehydrogenase family protein [Solirubrobacterales bacterium]|nr:zinc-dependent alcohol dehydrogenase family protein [Solirubrobacterales bacterium]MCB1009182.1 zinc-dependent alcohol dehydrogenase family protein [Acidobacteriota bacterium]
MRVRTAVLREMGAERPYADSKPLSVEEVELDPPGPGELLVKVRAAGLCHSDLSVIDGSRPRVMPMALGHEAAGEVVEVGPRPSTFNPGDHVVLAFVPACGDCEPCRAGRAALCEPGAAANHAGTLLSGERRLRLLGDGDGDGNGDGELNHHLGVSAFSDHIVVSEHSAVRVDPELPFELAALFGCAVLTGVGAAVNAARVEPDQSVVVFGLGGVGLSALLGAVLQEAGTLIAVDVVAEKLELARELGATHAVPAGPEAVAEIREITEGGADHAIETVGSAKVLHDAYAATRRGGATTTVGLPDPSQMLEIPAVSLVAEERTLRGSYLGSSVPARDLPKFIELHREGRLPVERLLTHRLSLDEINEGFDRLASGEAVRQAVIFD